MLFNGSQTSIYGPQTSKCRKLPERVREKGAVIKFPR